LVFVSIICYFFTDKYSLQKYVKYIYEKNFSVFFFQSILHTTDNQQNHFIHKKQKKTVVHHFFLF